MVRETGVQSQVELYQRLKKWYLILPCLTLSNIRYVLRVKWSNPWKGVAPSPTPRCSSYWKKSLLVALDYGRQHQQLASLYWWIYAIFNSGKFSSPFFSWVCLCHPLDIRPDASLSALFSSSQFVSVLPLSISRMVPNILQGRQSRCLSFW